MLLIIGDMNMPTVTLDRVSARRINSRKSPLRNACSAVLESLESRLFLSSPATFNPVGVGGTGACWWARANPQNASEVYASSDMGQVWHTTNGGTSWTTMKDIVGEASLSCVQFSGTAGTAFGIGTRLRCQRQRREVICPRPPTRA